METGTDQDPSPLSHECAFEALFREHHPTIVAAAYYRLSDFRDAEDAAAEVFSVAWRHRDQAPAIFTLRWLYGVLRNVVGDEYRRRRRRDEAHDCKLADPVNQAIDDPSTDDDARHLRLVIATLDLADRELIWMAYWEDLSCEDMAAILGCSQNAVRVRLLRARRRLRAAIQVHDEDIRPIGDR